MHNNTQMMLNTKFYYLSYFRFMLRLDKKFLYICYLTDFKINVPELLNNPAHPSTVDVLCGYLCLTTFFHRADLIKLFLTLPIHDRLKLCLEYFEKYSESLQ